MREINFLRIALYWLHKKFDGLPEPVRFLWMFGLMIIGISALSSHDLHGNIVVTAMGGIWLCALAMSRIGYIDGWLKVE